MKTSSKVNGPAIVAAVVATAGTAVAVTLVVRKWAGRRAGVVMDRCDRAVGELERQMTYAPSAC